MIDLYQLIQTEGRDYKVVRVTRKADFKTGLIFHETLVDTLQGAEVPPTYSLKIAKASYVDCTAFIVLDTYYAEEHPMFPFVEGDYVLIDRVSYRVHDMSTWDAATLLALKRVEGTPPYNIEEVAA